jgi:hypothetical protein
VPAGPLVVVLSSVTLTAGRVVEVPSDSSRTGSSLLVRSRPLAMAAPPTNSTARASPTAHGGTRLGAK